MAPTVTGSRRLDVVDALRGFALMAIVLLHNLEHYNLIGTPDSTPQWLASVDSAVMKSVFFLFAGKAYSIFSLLFGFSFYIQMRNAAARGEDFRLRFVWRMLLLMLFAQLHSVFYNGDILMLYAAVGLVLPLLCRLGDKALLAIAVICFLQPVEIGKVIYRCFNPDYVSTMQTAFLPYAERSCRVLEEGNFLQAVASNLTDGQLYTNLWQIGAGRLFMVLGLFLSGMLLGRRGLFEKSERQSAFWKRALAVSIPATALMYLVKSQVEPGADASLDLIIYSLTSLFFTGFWVSLFILLWNRADGYRFQRSAIPYGRMSLTNYIGQSVIGGTIYYGYGLSLYDDTGATACLLIAVLILAVQFWFSRKWLSAHRQGPLEYIWKKLTWIRCKATPKAAAAVTAVLLSSALAAPARAQAVESSDGRRWADMYELPAFAQAKGQEKVVRREAYTVSFNPQLRIPNWVAWILTKERLDSKVAARPDSDAFVPDPAIKGCPDRQYNYKEYRYERGHICPAADNRWSHTAMKTCFYMSNICPMSVALNHNSWNDVEEKSRAWAQKQYPGTTVYVVGGIVRSSVGKGGKGIPSHVGMEADIAVPFKLFKALLRNDPETGWTAIGYIFDQKGNVETATIDSIEALTGFDLFHNLPDRIESRVEAADGTPHWTGSKDIGN